MTKKKSGNAIPFFVISANFECFATSHVGSRRHTMKFTRNRLYLLVISLLLSAAGTLCASETTVTIASDASPRVQYGADQLRSALKSLASPALQRISINVDKKSKLRPEGFKIDSSPKGDIAITGADNSGALYGCLDLAQRIRRDHKIPTDLHFTDAPVMRLRGPCIGMQKTTILPGRHVYEYPYTPELFPFFYDKSFWREYLDLLSQNRMNTLYLWNGHPFASLVKLADYPDAVEVSPDVFKKNQEMYHWIASECDRRGIWLVQCFYNILLSKPFAEKHHLATQLHAPNPIAADYTRKSIAAFVKEYPHVGLMICLGEALQGNQNQEQWLNEVILPGVKDGMQQAGLHDEPPIIVRTHATDLRQYLPESLKIYHNLYTVTKYTGESLCTSEPRGKWQDIHLAMSRLGPHLVNVHILANLEPFRYGDVRFIQQCVRAARDRLGATGIHLYPLCYWNWPDAPDKTDPPLKQWKRDWIWFEAWARYAWNPDIDPQIDRAYWIGRLSEMYGSTRAAEKILAAYNDSGECAPRLIRRFGITEGNRQTLSLGMTLDELVHPEKYSVNKDLWESDAPPGERLQEYVEREWNHQPHAGETPVSIIREVLHFSQNAVQEIDAAEPLVTNNREEFQRLRNDVHAIGAMSQNYCDKANAAMLVLRFQHSHDVGDMEKAEEFLSRSLNDYRTLADLTKDTYRFANSMQTRQRKIPVPGGLDGKPANYNWQQLLPLYEKELADFQHKVNGLQQTAKTRYREDVAKKN
jgi:hypothetical protein